MGEPRDLSERVVSNLLDGCLGLRAGEEVVLLVDEGTEADVTEGLYAAIGDRDAVCVVARLPRYTIPGSEPPNAVAGLLAAADAAIELTSTFVGSSQARRRATEQGTRYLTMPAVTYDTFREDGPLDVDFAALRSTTERVAAAWANADTFRLSSRGGTDLRGTVTGRPGRALHGIAREAGSYMAPPDIEAGTAPIEGSAEGVVVIDGDFLFMGAGPLDGLVTLHIQDGELVGLEGAERDRLADMIERCADPRMTNLAEVALGLNPNGRVCGVPMETESTLGSAHIALGNSIAYGGTVAAVAHLDCVMRNATLELDGRPIMIEGRLCDE
jgi:leucyl aminopeptidase (aminopeptidase T)